MSHFTVAILCDSPEQVEELLAPYQENNMGDCPEKYMEFNDKTEECENEYEGFYFKEKYPLFADFVKNYFGYKFNEAENAYGYWENPNAKWDWYVIGGRWMGSLLVKNDSDGVQGRPGTFGNEVPNTPKGYKWVDCCRISDVDFKKMEALRRYEMLKDEPIDGDLWEILSTNNKPELRQKYTFYKSEWFIERYGNKENYVNSESAFSTYAVITPDGEWHSPGKMGWFGTSSEKVEDSQKFVDTYNEKFIEPYKDKIITIVDCHT